MTLHPYNQRLKNEALDTILGAIQRPMNSEDRMHYGNMCKKHGDELADRIEEVCSQNPNCAQAIQRKKKMLENLAKASSLKSLYWRSPLDVRDLRLYRMSREMALPNTIETSYILKRLAKQVVGIGLIAGILSGGYLFGKLMGKTTGLFDSYKIKIEKYLNLNN